MWQCPVVGEAWSYQVRRIQRHAISSDASGKMKKTSELDNFDFFTMCEFSKEETDQFLETAVKSTRANLKNIKISKKNKR